MPKAKTASDIGREGFKVRVVLHGALVHLFSETEPVVSVHNDQIINVEMTLIEGTEYGDTMGFIRWSDVSAITWRRA